MKKYLFLLIVAVLVAFLLTSCATKSTRETTYPDGTTVTEEFTDAASFNDTQASALANHKELIKNPPVIATLTAPDGSIINIHNQIVPNYPVVRQYKNQVVEGLKTVVNSTPLAIVAGGWSAKEIIKHSSGDITASDNASVATNSNNATDMRNADGDIVEDHSNNSDNSDHSNNSDNSTVDSHDQTATPTIVEQPEYNDPVIVHPEVVYPEATE